MLLTVDGNGELLIFIGVALAILAGGLVGAWVTRDSDRPPSREEKRRRYLLWWLTRGDR